VLLLIGLVLAFFVVPREWAGPVVIGAAAIELVETLVTLRYSRRAPPKVGVETLIGSLGRAITDCRPDGTVRVRGEAWRARSDPPAEADARIRVIGRAGLVLLVEPAEQEDGPDGLSSPRATGR
jgi:membrane-bound serine protease (ClpP class)